MYEGLRSVFKRRLRVAFWENFHPIKPMPAEFEVLARYNAEVTRGIVHTPEWRAKMAELQERFNEWVWSETERLGWMQSEGPRERPDA